MKFTSLLLAVGTAAAAWSQTPGNIEAAEYDPTQDRWFISNNTSLLVTEDAGATYAYFGSATATHGMEVIDGHLFSIGNNVVRAYDLETAALVGSVSIPGAGFLNGMGSRSGELVVSDFATGKLHRINITDPANMATEVLVNATGTTPNGVVIDEANNRALVVNWGANAPILDVDLTSGEFSQIVPNTGLGNLDGIDMDGTGQFYVSSWSPARITRYSNDFTVVETVVQGAASGLSNPADISYAIETDTLGVANSGNGTPSFHGFGATSGLLMLEASSEAVQWHANSLMLQSPVSGSWSIQVYNTAGQLQEEASLELPAAPVRIAPDRLGWAVHAHDIWRVQAPSGQTYAVRPGQHRP
jgi:hypothetical protein